MLFMLLVVDAFCTVSFSLFYLTKFIYLHYRVCGRDVENYNCVCGRLRWANRSLIRCRSETVHLLHHARCGSTSLRVA